VAYLFLGIFDFKINIYKTMKRIFRFNRFDEGKKDKFPDIKKFDIDGFVVYMGRDAKSNDHLTFNVADDEDIWMHAKGVPGSHVVIRVRENLPTETTIMKAAEIAKKNSKGKDREDVVVVYCQRKFVKKDPGMNDGQVKVDYINAHDVRL
jgi:predicted ribosome quality control (RQC) complex YloA/Tae2 family protein